MRRTVHMVPQFLALVLCAGSAFAQRLVDPAQLPETVKNFDLRLQAGYVVRAPVTTPTGVGHQWNLVLRPSPIGTSHPSFYFTDSIDIPTASRPDFVATVRGLFLVGEGQYHAAFSLLDDLGRTCRQKWTLRRTHRKMIACLRQCCRPTPQPTFRFSLRAIRARIRVHIRTASQ
jgi:hypothetical protein